MAKQLLLKYPKYKSSSVAQCLKSEKVNILSHPPYSPALAPCDFCLFPKLKKEKQTLSGRRYRSRSALVSAVNQFLMGVHKDEYENCFKHWIKRLKRCVLAKGEYFEGNLDKKETSTFN